MFCSAVLLCSADSIYQQCVIIERICGAVLTVCAAVCDVDCQANEKLNAAKKAVNIMEQEKLIADALDVSTCLSQLLHILVIVMMGIICRMSIRLNISRSGRVPRS